MRPFASSPDYADAFNDRGVVYEAKGDLEGARQDFDEAARLRSERRERLRSEPKK